MRVKWEGEWNSVIFFLFVMFVVLTVDQFVERGDGPFELQKQEKLAVMQHITSSHATFDSQNTVVTIPENLPLTDSEKSKEA